MHLEIPITQSKEKNQNDKEDHNMKEFEVTLTAVSSKTFKLKADSQEDAFLLAEAILENTDLLGFSDEDVDSIPWAQAAINSQ